MTNKAALHCKEYNLNFVSSKVLIIELKEFSAGLVVRCLIRDPQVFAFIPIFCSNPPFV